MKKIQYHSTAERDGILAAHSAEGYLLKEEHNHLDGNFLILYEPAEAEAYLTKLRNDRALEKLKEIDAASIRSIREYLAAKGDAPRCLKDHEAQALQEREKLVRVAEPAEPEGK